MKNTEISSLLGAEWKTLEPSEKQEYIQLNKDLKVTYDRAIEEYTERYPNWREEEKAAKEAAKKSKKSTRKDVTKKTPKQARRVSAKLESSGSTFTAFTGYSLFQYATRAKAKQQRGKPLGKREGNSRIADLWDELSSAERAKWTELSTNVNQAQEEVNTAAAPTEPESQEPHDEVEGEGEDEDENDIPTEGDADAEQDVSMGDE